MPDDPTPEPELNVIIDINVKDPAWTEALPHLDALATEVVGDVLAKATSWQHFTGPRSTRTEVSICFADTETVQDLNARYRDKNSPTNVLSFPADPAPDHPETQEALLGDVVLAFGVVLDEAKAQGKSLQDHTVHLLVHGVLHLLGYDHNEDKAASEMEALEIKTLADLGIADPYAISKQAEI